MRVAVADKDDHGAESALDVEQAIPLETRGCCRANINARAIIPEAPIAVGRSHRSRRADVELTMIALADLWICTKNRQSGVAGHIHNAVARTTSPRNGKGAATAAHCHRSGRHI